jgi:hypothetical protein
MNHKQKTRFARKLLSNEEKREDCSIFQSEAWDMRKYAKFEKVQRQREAASDRKKIKNFAS